MKELFQWPQIICTDFFLPAAFALTVYKLDYLFVQFLVPGAFPPISERKFFFWDRVLVGIYFAYGVIFLSHFNFI